MSSNTPNTVAVRLQKELNQRLTSLATKTGRSKKLLYQTSTDSLSRRYGRYLSGDRSH